MGRITFFIVALLLIVTLEIYVFYGLRTAFPEGRRKIVVLVLYAISIIAVIAGIVSMRLIFMGQHGNMGFWSNFLVGVMFTLIISKLIYSGSLLIEDSFRIVKFSFQKIAMWFSGHSAPIEIDGRRKFISQIGLGIAAIPFTGFLYGILKGKYDYKVHYHMLSFNDLPNGFDGLRIVQISDFHSGSFDNIDEVAKGIQLIQDQNPDLILFTGDLVNNLASEIEPYKHLLKNLSAPMGKYAVLGNHDYGEYVKWPTKQKQIENTEKIKQHLEDMGFTMLNNDSVSLTKNGDQLQLVGVENWGKPPFPAHGDLDKALENINKDDFTILMSHDPDHWEEKALPHVKNINLTLSGHTHGMQMGIEIPGIKWSPVKYKYSRWAGLYKEQGQYLYVNRGFGFIGYPGRIGIWPEITVFELKTEHNLS